MPVARRLAGQTSAAYGPITGQPPLPTVETTISSSQNTEIEPIVAVANMPAATVATAAPRPTMPAEGRRPIASDSQAKMKRPPKLPALTKIIQNDATSGGTLSTSIKRIGDHRPTPYTPVWMPRLPIQETNRLRG